MFKKIVFLLTFILFCTVCFSTVRADEAEDLNNKITEYTQKLNELGTAKNTLANQIKILTSQYELTLLKISQTENSIKSFEKEINNLTIEIDKLNGQLNELSSLYVLQIIQNYKLQKNIPPFTFLFSSRLNNFLEQYKYVANVQKASQNSLINMETIRSNYDAQKTAKTKKQQEMETLQKTLASQKITLNNQKAAKDQLLTATKNDEKIYQQKLADAQRQLSSLKNFSSGAGGESCIAANQPTGSDGNFYSQRDGLWCNQIINNSSDKTDTIGRIGCAISSYAIVLAKKGQRISPSAIAADPSNFDSISRVLINKLQGNSQRYSSSKVDSELKAGRYVIAELSAFYGTHFVVIISGNSGNYKIHDPWFGPDQNLNDHYSTGRIISIRIMW
ncbi:MAG: hypothetical protein PHE32_02655 [Candidatus Shapirobacteria bacterium]|nr:hypothetical protein [Candidatus Shapirobacteria bacterium]MDD4410573.1 hypothetical protein [Candidatus Shapirobacteria bacterium]